ncbi:MAG TPA: TolC family protein [Pirellulales bacterium]|jgi:hypothetical protein|nr:TolC family protein [Pirellulales bacterium]
MASAFVAQDTARGKILADVSQVGSWTEVDQKLSCGDRPAHYLLLLPNECRCRAASQADVAALLEIERVLGMQVAASSCADKRHLAAIQQQLLRLRADSRRNEAASRALTAFYQLAAAEAACDATDRSVNEVRRMIADHERIKQLTGQSPPDINSLAQREIEILNQRAEAFISVTRLNLQLRRMLAIDPADSRAIWPKADLSPIAQPLDVDSARGFALAQRSELQSLRLILSSLGPDTLPLARAAVAQQDSALGTAAPACWILHPDLADRELAARRQQLGRSLAAAQQAIADEIHGLVLDVQMNLRQVAAAKQNLEYRQHDFSGLQAKHAVDAATAFDLAAAQLAVIQAEHELISRAVDWRIAEVRLREAEGCLAIDCGCESMSPISAQPAPEIARSVFTRLTTR